MLCPFYFPSSCVLFNFIWILSSWEIFISFLQHKTRLKPSTNFSCLYRFYWSRRHHAKPEPEHLSQVKSLSRIVISVSFWLISAAALPSHTDLMFCMPLFCTSVNSSTEPHQHCVYMRPTSIPKCLWMKMIPNCRCFCVSSAIATPSIHSSQPNNSIEQLKLFSKFLQDQKKTAFICKKTMSGSYMHCYGYVWKLIWGKV